MTPSRLFAAATLALTFLDGCGTERGDLAPLDLDAGSASVAPLGDATNVTATCAEGSWCWESPKPQGDALGSVWLNTATDGWAAGGHGALLRLGAAGWSLQPQPTDMDITDLWGSGATDVWAVANPPIDTGSTETGGILHWDGSAWQLMKPGSTYYSWLAGSTADDVWALSWADGPTTAFHWDGTAWSAAPAPAANYMIAALCVRGTNDVWAAAADANVGSDPTAILHWDGASWTQSYSLPITFQRFDLGLACGLGTDVWAPYYDYNAQAYSGVYWDGNGWQTLPLPAPLAAGWADVDRLRVTHDGSFVVLDYSGPAGAIYRWTAGNWQTISPVASSSVGLVGASTYGDLDFAPGGTGWLVTPAGDFVPWSGTAWDTTGLTSRDSLVGLAGAPGGPPTFAIGESEYVGRRTTPASGPTWAFAAPARAPSLLASASWAAGPDDLWVAAAGTATHFEGGATASFALSTTAEIVAFGGTSPSNVWAIDTGGVVSRWNGTRWSAYAPSFPQTVGGSGPALSPVGIWVAGPTEAWVVANGLTPVPCGSPAADPPAIVHWDGAEWSAQWLASSGSARAIGGTSATDVWVTGTMLWRLGAGAIWAPVPQVGSLAAGALQVTAHGVYWLGGPSWGALTVARWDKEATELTTWTIPVSDNVAIQALWVGARAPGGPDTIWVAGSNEGVLAFEP